MALRYYFIISFFVKAFKTFSLLKLLNKYVWRSPTATNFSFKTKIITAFCKYFLEHTRSQNERTQLGKHWPPQEEPWEDGFWTAWTVIFFFSLVSVGWASPHRKAVCVSWSNFQNKWDFCWPSKWVANSSQRIVCQLSRFVTGVSGPTYGLNPWPPNPISCVVPARLFNGH